VEQQPAAEGRVAVLVDCDNTTPELLEYALRAVAQFGRLVIRRGYGLVSDLLDLCEEIFHGEVMSEADRFTLLVAATAAPFVRQERKERNIDSGDA